jgi:pimeloyl-ACP methyl ester carboxylesterase
MYLCDGTPEDKMEKKMEKYRRSKKKAASLGKTLPFIKSAYYWYLIYDYDHDKAIKNLTCPTLLLYAEHDANVPPEQNIQHLEEVFNQDVPSNFTIRVMEGGQHGFYKVSNRCVDWSTAEKQPFDSQFQDEIRKWVIALAE